MSRALLMSLFLGAALCRPALGQTVVLSADFPTWPDPAVGTNRFRPTGGIGNNANTNRLYVTGVDHTGQAHVAVVDATTGALALIDLPTWTDPRVGTNRFLPSGVLCSEQCDDVAVDGLTDRVYISGADDTGSFYIAMLDGSSHEVILIPLPTWPDARVGTVRFVPAGNIAVDPVANRVYLPGSDDTGQFHIAIMDGTTMAVSLAQLPTWADPAVGTNRLSPRGRLAVDSLRNRVLFPAQDDTGHVYVGVMDGATNAVSLVEMPSWPGGNRFRPDAIAVNPSTNRIYAADSWDVAAIRGDTFAIEFLELPSWVVPDFGTNRFRPASLAVNAMTNRLYIPGHDFMGGRFVAVADLTTNAVTLALEGTSSVATPSVNAITNRLYVLEPLDVLIIDMGGNTTIGSDVVITAPATLPDGSSATISLSFDEVTAGGQTSVTTSSAGPPPPAGFKLTSPPVFYEITTTATFSGSVRVFIGWTEGQIAYERNVNLFHHEGGLWVNITDPASIDTERNIVCGTANSLSPFTLFEVTYAFVGFFQPVDNPPVVNVVKAGAAVTIKFSLGGDFGLDILAGGNAQSVLVQCATGAPLDVLEETLSAGASGLSYDSSTGMYKYVWKTDKAWAGQCRRFEVRLSDGEVYTAIFTMSR